MHQYRINGGATCRPECSIASSKTPADDDQEQEALMDDEI
jgi:hypothetical protein